MESQDNSVVDVEPAFRASGFSGFHRYTILAQGCEEWIEPHPTTVVYVDIVSPNIVYECTSVYLTFESYARIDGMEMLCSRHFSHPLYNHTMGYEDGVGMVVVDSDTMGPISVHKGRPVSGLSKTIYLPDINPIQCSWTCLLVTDEASAVCYNDNTSDYHRLMVCSRDVQIAMQTMHQVYNGIRGRDTHIHHNYATRVWCASIRSMSNIDGDLVVHVPSTMLHGTELGMFISAPGVASLLYIDTSFAVSISLTTTRCNLAFVGHRGLVRCIGTFKVYDNIGKWYIDRALTYNSVDPTLVCMLCDNIEPVQHRHSARWREYVPHSSNLIRVRPSPSTQHSLQCIATSMVLTAISRMVDTIMIELSWSSILIHGEPTSELMGLSHKYMCHYVYPYTWDDDIANIESYGDIQVYHQPSLTESVGNIVPKSINVLVSDEDYASIPTKMLTLYLPCQDRTVIRRNEFEMYVSIDYTSDVLRPYNSREFEITNTTIYKVLYSMHVEIPSIVFHYHPSLSAYLECL
jgi:hypothetical protein